MIEYFGLDRVELFDSGKDRLHPLRQSVYIDELHIYFPCSCRYFDLLVSRLINFLSPFRQFKLVLLFVRSSISCIMDVQINLFLVNPENVLILYRSKLIVLILIYHLLRIFRLLFLTSFHLSFFGLFLIENVAGLHLF